MKGREAMGVMKVRRERATTERRRNIVAVVLCVSNGCSEALGRQL